MELHNKDGERVNLGGMIAASVDVNSGIAADVEPAVAAQTGLALCGFSYRESAGTPAVAAFNIVNGATVAGGTHVAVAEVAANGSDTIWLGDSGVDCANGISIDIVAGTVDVILYYKVL